MGLETRRMGSSGISGDGRVAQPCGFRPHRSERAAFPHSARNTGSDGGPSRRPTRRGRTSAGDGRDSRGVQPELRGKSAGPLNPTRRAVRGPAAGMNLLHAGRQLRIAPRASGRRTSTPRVVPPRGDTEHAGHRGDAETTLIRAHEPASDRHAGHRIVQASNGTILLRATSVSGEKTLDRGGRHTYATRRRRGR